MDSVHADKALESSADKIDCGLNSIIVENTFYMIDLELADRIKGW